MTTPRTMKAAILVALKQPLEIAEISLPEELSYGQVMVKVLYSGICGTQLNEIAGAKGEDKWLPHLLGHEGYGIVEEIGPGVRTVAVGDPVVLHWRQGAGLQSETPKYRWGDRVVNAGWVTTFNEYAVVSENRVTTIPADFDGEAATLFGCAVTTGLGAVTNDAALRIGESAVVFGVGGVGLNVVQGAALASAHPIVAVDLYDQKLEAAKQFGATHSFNARSTQDLNARIREIVGPGGADVVFETTGNPRVIEQAYDLTHADGRTILLGVPVKGDNVSIYTLPLHFKKVLKGSHGGEAQPHLDIPRYIRLVEAGKLHLDGLITHHFTLDQINEAIDLMRRGETGRVIIDMRRA